MRKFSVILLILLVCAAIICGCTVPSSSSPKAAAPSSQPAVQSTVQQPATPASNGIVKKVEIIQSSFDPDIVSISAGTTVVWTNKDTTFNHRVVHLPELPSDKELFHSELLSYGDTFSYTFNQPGRYRYSDPQHGSGRYSLVIVT
jgi:plastocyanin